MFADNVSRVKRLVARVITSIGNNSWDQVIVIIVIVIIMIIITNTRLSRRTGGWLPAVWWGQLDLGLMDEH